MEKRNDSSPFGDNEIIRPLGVGVVPAIGMVADGFEDRMIIVMRVPCEEHDTDDPRYGHDVDLPFSVSDPEARLLALTILRASDDRTDERAEAVREMGID